VNRVQQTKRRIPVGARFSVSSRLAPKPTEPPLQCASVPSRE